MPSPLVKSLSQKLNIPVEKVESAWKKAKVAVASSLKKEVSALEGNDFALVTNQTKRLLGVKEIINIVAFLKSDKSAKDFVEDMVSTGAGVGHSLDTVVIPPKKPIAQPKDDEDLSGGVGMYSDDEEDGPTPARVVTLTKPRRSPTNEEPDIYENHSKINMNDLAGGPNHGPDTGASERLAALAETVVPDKRFVASTEKPPVAPIIGRTAPIAENRSRLDASELNQLLSTSSKPANIESAMTRAPFKITTVVEESEATTPEDTANARAMAEFQEDLFRMAETGVEED